MKPLLKVNCDRNGMNFKYTFRQDGWVIEAFDLNTGLKLVRKHAERNGYPMPDPATVEHEACMLMPPGNCHYEDGTPQKLFIDRRFGIEDLVHGTQVLIEFVKQGSPMVSQELAESRAATCAACYALLNFKGCAPCLGLAGMVDEVSGMKKTKADAQLQLKACGVCKCVARAQIWVPIEIMERGITPEMDALWPEWCWKKNERQPACNSTETA